LTQLLLFFLQTLCDTNSETSKTLSQFRLFFQGHGVTSVTKCLAPRHSAKRHSTGWPDLPKEAQHFIFCSV